MTPTIQSFPRCIANLKIESTTVDGTKTRKDYLSDECSLVFRQFQEKKYPETVKLLNGEFSIQFTAEKKEIYNIDISKTQNLICEIQNCFWFLIACMFFGLDRALVTIPKKEVYLPRDSLTTAFQRIEGYTKDYKVARIALPLSIRALTIPDLSIKRQPDA